MTENVLIAIITSGAGFLGLVGGYFIREFQNRAKNLIYVYNIGSTQKNTDLIDIEDTLVQKINSGNQFAEFKSKTQFQYIDRNWDYCDDLKLVWKNMEEIIDKILDSKNETEAIDLIADLFEKTKFDPWVLIFLSRNLADDLRNKTKTTEVVKINETDREGLCFVEFPRKNIPFLRTDNPAIISKADILLNNVKVGNIDNIKKLLERFKRFMNTDYNIAVQNIDELKEIKNKQSRWMFYVQISNISKNPILFGLNPSISIFHGNNTYELQLYTALFSETGSVEDTRRPVLVNSNETKDIVLITKDIEKDFKNGKTIREVFEKNLGQFQIKWNIIRPGFFQKQNISSRKQDFNMNHFA